jgi:hypothetical protein
MKTCFFTCYETTYQDVANKLRNSVKKFYPDIPFIDCILPRHDSEFNLKEFCDFHLENGKQLLGVYDRIISLDTDEIMCNKCPDLFGDFDLGVVRNNIPFEVPNESPKGNVYINAGLTVCTNKDVWFEWMAEYQNRCNQFPGEGLNEQNALNWIFHKSTRNIQLLEYPDRVYGISAMDYGYPNMYLKEGELWVKWKAGEQCQDKKLCVFHAAGVEWKDKATGGYNLELIHNPEAREKLISYGT